MPQIPNTNLTLSETEIQAVIAYYLTRDTASAETNKEEFEIPEKYKETCKPGMFKKHYGDNPPIPKYFTPVNNEVV